MASFKDRLVGVLTVDASAFEEIEHASDATSQAAIVAVIAAIASGIGGGFLAGSIGSGFMGTAVWALVSWVLWAGITYVIGCKVFDGDADFGQMLRVIGFAYAPAAFNIFSLIPIIGIVILLLVAVWLLASVFVGVRAGLDLDNGKVFITVFVGWFVYLIGLGIVGSIFGMIGF